MLMVAYALLSLLPLPLLLPLLLLLLLLFQADRKSVV